MPSCCLGMPLLSNMISPDAKSKVTRASKPFFCCYNKFIIIIVYYLRKM